MKTSHFAAFRTSSTLNAVAITVSMSKYIYVKNQYKALAPTWALLSAFREGRIGESQYIEQYSKQLSKLDPKKVYADLCNLSGSTDPILICHCSKKDFCHRHLAAEWLEKGLGVEITEVGHQKTTRLKGYCSNQEPQVSLL